MGAFFGKLGKLGSLLSAVSSDFLDSIINGGNSKTTSFANTFDCEDADSELTSEDNLIDCKYAKD